MTGKPWVRYVGHIQYMIGDSIVSRDEWVKAGGDVKIGKTPPRPLNWRGKWPLKSAALAVHPDQVAEANERNRQHGVNVEYHPNTGKAIIPDAAAYKRLRKLEGVHDRDGYSGY